MALAPPRLPGPSWRWAALLMLALLTPAALPAGGGERRVPDVRRRAGADDPLLADDRIPLRSAPAGQAPVLVRIEPHAPLRVLRRWFAPDGRRWLHVAVASPAGQPARGWLPG